MTGLLFYAHFPIHKPNFHDFMIFKEEISYGIYQSQAVTVLQTLVIALGAGLAVWGVVNLMEGYGNDNPGANAHGW